MGAAEHVGLSDGTGRDSDGGDCGVELCVRGREEQFFQKTAEVGSFLHEVELGVVLRILRRDLGDIDDEGELVHEFVLAAFVRFAEAAEKVHHQSCHALAEPNVAVHDPDYIALCLAVCSAHVPDLGVGTKVTWTASLAREILILIFDEEPDIEPGIIVDQSLHSLKG